MSDSQRFTINAQTAREDRLTHCTPMYRTARRFKPSARAAAFAAACAVSLPPFAFADDHVSPPDVPANIQVTDGSKPFLVGHAKGTQNYVCLPSSTGVAFTLFTPEATLFNDDKKQIVTHFFSPNPDENNTNPAVAANGLIRATWLSRDSSTVWGQVKQGDSADSSSAPDFVMQGAIAWLKVTAVGHEFGPTGGDTLARATFIQRVNTVGGLAPSTGCTDPSEIGNLAFVPYKADYVFYNKGH